MARRVAPILVAVLVFATMGACSSVPDLQFEPDGVDSGSRDAGKEDGPAKDASPVEDATPYNEGGSTNTCPGTPPPGAVLCCTSIACAGTECVQTRCVDTCEAKCNPGTLCCMGKNANKTTCKPFGGSCP